VHVDSGRDELFIGRPVTTRLVNDQSFFLSRPIRKPDGGFGGVFVALINPEYFAHFFDAGTLGRGGGCPWSAPVRPSLEERELRRIPHGVRGEHRGCGLARPSVGPRKLDPETCPRLDPGIMLHP
jgi:hypothetical protein